MLFMLVNGALEALRLGVVHLTSLLNGNLTSLGSEILVYIISVAVSGYIFFDTNRDWTGKQRQQLAARYALMNLVVGLALVLLFGLLFDGDVFSSLSGAFEGLNFVSAAFAIIIGMTLALIILLVTGYLIAHFVLFCVARGLGGTAKPIGGEVS